MGWGFSLPCWIGMQVWVYLLAHAQGATVQPTQTRPRGRTSGHPDVAVVGIEEPAATVVLSPDGRAAETIQGRYSPLGCEAGHIRGGRAARKEVRKISPWTVGRQCLLCCGGCSLCFGSLRWEGGLMRWVEKVG